MDFPEVNYQSLQNLELMANLIPCFQDDMNSIRLKAARRIYATLRISIKTRGNELFGPGAFITAEIKDCTHLYSDIFFTSNG